jgi:hypothetical protein
MAVTEQSTAVVELVYGRPSRRIARRTPEEYEAIWHGLHEQALARCDEPNAARYAANQAFAEIEADDNGRVVGRGDYELFL